MAVVGSRGWSCGGGAFKFLSFVVVDVVKRYMVVVVVVGSGRSKSRGSGEGFAVKCWCWWM